MKKILVLHTGGTISMHADQAGNVRPDTDNPMNHIGVSLDNIEVTAIDFFNIQAHASPLNTCSSFIKKSSKKLRILTEWSLPTVQTPWKKRLIS